MILYISLLLNLDLLLSVSLKIMTFYNKLNLKSLYNYSDKIVYRIKVNKSYKLVIIFESSLNYTF